MAELYAVKGVCKFKDVRGNVLTQQMERSIPLDDAYVEDFIKTFTLVMGKQSYNVDLRDLQKMCRDIQQKCKNTISSKYVKAYEFTNGTGDFTIVLSVKIV